MKQLTISPSLQLSRYARDLKQSGIRAASVRCGELNGVNLGQGICDIQTDEVVKQAAIQAIAVGHNMYGAFQGLPELRQAIAKKLQSFNQMTVDPDTEVLVSTGATGAFVATVKALFDPGDEIIVFEPYYGYHCGILKLFNITVKSVKLSAEDYTFALSELQAAISPKTKGILVCTPNNPTGKVFTEAELLTIGALAQQHDLYLVVDEIYEYITYPGHRHVSMASLRDFSERTVTISGFSKTYHVTGWRLGYVSGPAKIIEKMALIHDLLYVCPPSPLQHGALAALSMPASYYDTLRTVLLQKRDMMVAALRELGFIVQMPQGAYYLLVDISQLPFTDDEDAATKLLENAGVATVTGRSFYSDPALGRHKLRICYALSGEGLAQAVSQLGSYLL